MMDYFMVEAVGHPTEGDGTDDVLLRLHWSAMAWRLTNAEARRLARRLVTYADACEHGPEGASYEALSGAAARKVEPARRNPFTDYVPDPEVA